LKQFWLIHKIWITYLKIALAFLTIGFIFYKLLIAYQIDEKFASFQFNFSFENAICLGFAVILLLANWGLETIKWQLLINQFEEIKFFNSLKAVFSGVTLSIITPNQIGDFAGRVIHLKTLNKIKGSLITVIGHTAQSLVTAIFGMYALLAFLAKADFYVFIYWKYIAISFLIVHAVLVFGFIRINLVYNLLARFKFFSKIEQYVIVFKAYTKTQLTKVLLISILRYSVFLVQYVLLLQFFGVYVGLVNCFIGVMAVFCIQSIVPSFFLLDIGLRGASALFVFGELSNGNHGFDLGILLSAYSLWVINMMVPALLGLVFILKHKFSFK
jgi:hypothetical protein